jgi:hypothetical protein
VQAGDPVGLLALVVLGTALVWRGAGPWLARAWRSPPVVWLGRAALGAVAIASAAELVRDARTIL